MNGNVFIPIEQAIDWYYGDNQTLKDLALEAYTIKELERKTKVANDLKCILRTRLSLNKLFKNHVNEYDSLDNIIQLIKDNFYIACRDNIITPALMSEYKDVLATYNIYENARSNDRAAFDYVVIYEDDDCIPWFYADGNTTVYCEKEDAKILASDQASIYAVDNVEVTLKDCATLERM